MPRDVRAPRSDRTPVIAISAVFPAYDEVDSIERTLTRARDALTRLGVERFELIVVDDGSTDGTGAAVTHLATTDPRVRLVTHAANRGYGAAVKSGFDAATLEWVFLTDGDGQFDVGELGDFLPLTDRYDAIIGRRLDRADHLGRKLNQAAWNALVRATFGLPFTDVDCAFKLIRRETLVRIGPLDADGAFLSTELLVKLSRVGARITQLGVHHYPRRAGAATGADPRVIVQAFRELVRLRRRIGRATAGHGPGRAGPTS